MLVNLMLTRQNKEEMGRLPGNASKTKYDTTQMHVFISLDRCRSNLPPLIDNTQPPTSTSCAVNLSFTANNDNISIKMRLLIKR